jgi:hypothetical protein
VTEGQDHYRQYLETLTPATLDFLGDYVTDDVRFRDPFNDVRGAAASRPMGLAVTSAAWMRVF